jgi:hypothetical protein
MELLRDGKVYIDPMITKIANYKEAPYIYNKLLTEKNSELGIIFRWQ